MTAWGCEDEFSSFVFQQIIRQMKLGFRNTKAMDGKRFEYTTSVDECFKRKSPLTCFLQRKFGMRE